RGTAGHPGQESPGQKALAEAQRNDREEMSAAPSAAVGDNEVARLFERRAASVDEFAGHAGTVAAACHDMAVRFHQGGKLVFFGTGASSTDALHVAVEFVHPVIVGKRALPAISLTAHGMGMLTIALAGAGGGVIGTSPAVDHALVTTESDPRVVKEAHVTAYHVLWELVHVFFEQPGVLGPAVVS